MTPTAAAASDRLDNVEDDIKHLIQTIYTGNGQEALITRMAVAEKTLAAMLKLGWLVLATGLTSTGTLLAHILVSHGK